MSGPAQKLRLAFFGSDMFSLVSLRRLVAMKSRNETISHIDVFTRSIKPTGRKLKTFIDVPVGEYGTSNGLDVFRVDSAQQINEFSERKYDLAVAVSFGKLIPGLFLSSLRLGGLNVHPSLLPKYSGSSPIQYALMNDCKSTGVTVQTLHPTKFDHGDILRQSDAMEIGARESFTSLRDRLAVVGADLLEDVILHENLVDPKLISSPEKYSLAPKIPPTLAEVHWDKMTSRQICRLEDALGPLFSFKAVDVIKKKVRRTEPAKVILEGFTETSAGPQELTKPGDFALKDNEVVVKTADSYVSIGKLKYQFCNYEEPLAFMANLKLRAGDTPLNFSQK